MAAGVFHKPGLTRHFCSARPGAISAARSSACHTKPEGRLVTVCTASSQVYQAELPAGAAVPLFHIETCGPMAEILAPLSGCTRRRYSNSRACRCTLQYGPPHNNVVSVQLAGAGHLQHTFVNQQENAPPVAEDASALVRASVNSWRFDANLISEGTNAPSSASMSVHTAHQYTTCLYFSMAVTGQVLRRSRTVSRNGLFLVSSWRTIELAWRQQSDHSSFLFRPCSGTVF